jgi:hypothetical protein
VRSPAADRQSCAAHLLPAADREPRHKPEPGAGESLARIASVPRIASLRVLVGRRSSAVLQAHTGAGGAIGGRSAGQEESRSPFFTARLVLVLLMLAVLASGVIDEHTFWVAAISYFGRVSPMSLDIASARDAKPQSSKPCEWTSVPRQATAARECLLLARGRSTCPPSTFPVTGVTGTPLPGARSSKMT